MCDWEVWKICAQVPAISYFFGLMEMEKCEILWEKMRFGSKEDDLSIELYEIYCCTFRVMAITIVILQSKQF